MHSVMRTPMRCVERKQLGGSKRNTRSALLFQSCQYNLPHRYELEQHYRSQSEAVAYRILSSIVRVFFLRLALVLTCIFLY